MDHAATQATVFLFGCALPGSLFGWTMAVIGTALLREPEDQPAWYRIYMRVMSSFVSENPNHTVIAFGIVCVAFFNFVPVSLLVHNPYGSQSLIVDLVYLAVESAFLVPLARAIVRTRARGRGR
jgi:MFS family permease